MARTTYDRARLLADRLGRMGDIFRSLWGLWMGAHSAGQHVRARSLLDEMYEVLEKTDEPEYVVQAHHAAGSQMHAEGKLRRAKSLHRPVPISVPDRHSRQPGDDLRRARSGLLLARDEGIGPAHARLPGPGQ